MLDTMQTDNMQSVLKKIEASLEQMLVGKVIDPIEDLTESPLVNRVIEMINMLSGNFAEMAAFSRALSKGDMDIDIPGRRNYLAAPLKELHSQLSSFVWTAQQLERGQVVERLDYMGELSTAMNGLIDRVAAGLESVPGGGEISADTQQYQQVLTAFNHMPQMMFIVDSAHNVLLANQLAMQHFGKLNRLVPANGDRSPVDEALSMQSSEDNTFPVQREVFDGVRGVWYKITTDRMLLPGNEIAYLHCVEDITERKENESKLKISASVDALTGVYNRAIGMKALETAIISKMRTAFCAAFIDIDKLKYINDTFGHNEGDFAIKSIAEALASSVRESDTVSRFGGDEFLIVFSGCSIDAAESVIERMRAKIEALNAVSGKPYELSFSHGITRIDPESDIVAADLIQLMDKKMYERKKAKHMRLAKQGIGNQNLHPLGG